MATSEASTVTYDAIQSTSYEIYDFNLSIAAMTRLVCGEDKSGERTGICSPFGLRFSLNTIVIGLLCILGLAGNTISILVLQKDQNNRVAVLLLQSLAVADNSVLCIAFIVLSIIYGLEPVLGNDARLSHFIAVTVKYMNPLGNIAFSVSTWLTVLLAVNRYVAICRPFKAKRWLTVAYARVQVAIVVVVCVLLNVPMMRFGDSPCAKNSSNCTETKRKILAQETWFDFYYQNAFYLPVVFIFPLVLLVALNVPIIRQMQHARLRMKRSSISYSGRQETNITIVLVVIILELIVCHTPDRIRHLVRLVDVIVYGKRATPKCPEFMFIAVNLTNLLMVANSSTNFIVYYVLRSRFRRILAQKLCCSRGSNPAAPDQSPLPSLATVASLHHSHSHHKHRHRKSSAEVDAKAMTLRDRFRLTKKRDSNTCLLKVNNTCM